MVVHSIIDAISSTATVGDPTGSFVKLLHSAVILNGVAMWCSKERFLVAQIVPYVPTGRRSSAFLDEL